MSDNEGLREKARITLKGRIFGSVWCYFALIVFLFTIITWLPNGIGDAIAGKKVALIASVGVFSFLLTLLVSGPMTYGIARAFLNVKRGGKEEPDVADLFVGFKEAVYDAFLLGIIRSALIALWCILLIVPGVIKAYSYSMAFYIQQESSDKEWRSCLERSRRMMDGYKWKLFTLDVGFLGWYIVGALCAGVGVFWTSAYHGMARAHFYDELKAARGEGEEAVGEECLFRDEE